jgi:hypothetical protein
MYTSNLLRELVISLGATLVRVCRGVCIYCVKAEDFHWPRAYIIESLRPACAAAIEAPMHR